MRADDGYAYLYRKTVRLVKGKPELLIEHSLRNRKQSDRHYADNHNCFVIDHEVVGPDLDFKFVCTPKLVPVFRHELEDKGVFTELAESGTEIKDYDFRYRSGETIG